MSPLKIGQDPKRKSHLPTSHFPGAYVSFREDGFSLPNWVVLQVSSHLKFSESNCNLAMVVKIRFWFKRTPQTNIKVRLRNYVILVYLPTRDPLLSHFFWANWKCLRCFMAKLIQQIRKSKLLPGSKHKICHGGRFNVYRGWQVKIEPVSWGSNLSASNFC